jgi:crotonobetainyl-CoA:carnitine CoA-transferase CaiB-like acyl-CoA transferase
MNILLALRQREATMRGQHLDIAMAAGSAAFAWYGRAHLSAYGHAPHGGETLLTGASPRYRIYATSDGWFVAVGALEDKFWRVFCDALGLADSLRGRDAMASGVIRIVAEEIASKPAAHWRAVLEPIDCCCTVVRTLEEAEIYGPRYEAMTQTQGGLKTPLAVLPIAPELRKPQIAARPVPPLKPLMD